MRDRKMNMRMKTMKIYRINPNFSVKAIDFCCYSMSHAVIRENIVKIGFYTEAYAEMNGTQLRYCPFCGVKVEFIRMEESDEFHTG